jgi:hypothetical protein
MVIKRYEMTPRIQENPSSDIPQRMRQNIRNHAYTFEHALQQQTQVEDPEQPASPPSTHTSTYYTWLVFLLEKWIPFDAPNQRKVEQTLNLGGTFVDIQDTHFPSVKRVRVFPKSNYLSYLGVKYRLSRIIETDPGMDHQELKEGGEDEDEESDEDEVDGIIGSNRRRGG